MLSLRAKRNRGILIADRKGTPLAIVFPGDRPGQLDFTNGPLRYTRTEGMEEDTLRDILRVLGENEKSVQAIAGGVNHAKSG